MNGDNCHDDAKQNVENDKATRHILSWFSFSFDLNMMVRNRIRSQKKGIAKFSRSETVKKALVAKGLMWLNISVDRKPPTTVLEMYAPRRNKANP